MNIKNKKIYIECENDINKGINAVAEILTEIAYESEEFEKKLLLEIKDLVDDANKELESISSFLNQRIGKIDTNDQAILNILQKILEEI